MRDRAVGSGRHALSHWTRIGNSEAAVSVDTQTGPSAELPRSLKVAVTAATAGAPVGVQNDGYWAWRFARKSERATVTVKMLYAGYSMQQEHVDARPAPDPYLAEALEEMGDVSGATSMKWNALRSKDGHPAPFPLHCLEIGNEDSFDKSGSYDGRFAQYFKGIKQRYPNLQLIATAPVESVKPDVLDVKKWAPPAAHP